MVSIAFSGGGTGGHIYPGLAVAAHLEKLTGCRIFWIGSKTGIDRAIVEKAGLEFFGISSGKLRREINFRNLVDIFKVMAGFFGARRILRREKPALLFSKGGFVSVPPCAAAASLHIPVCTHESDYSPGLATRLNARFAGIIFTAYEETAAFFPPAARTKLRVLGNPVRPEFHGAGPERGRAFLGLGPGERILLVLGGSLGARQLNELVRESLPELTRHYTVVHQTGPQSNWDIPAGERYRPYPFIYDEMPQVVAAAELVLCRSGAGTIWECAALGKPMILVPLAGSGTRGDQVENARHFQRAGAAEVLTGEAVQAATLAALVARLAGDEARRRSMGEAASRFAGADAAALIAAVLRDEIKDRL
ncbi:MAG: undecaprenyldiphospho-muramoylpentapeptide beta-N-acetylglucosaminyltransferase [Treponema sp.]|jgi:UDP-N-acetylglucosamine--N-acetylmuramyl-(pentapeptide) pyrophosphoryl-undecaprenol N-acetylglucosamine transferase|nr:undecaprenyldiphospho-muramoylpentapeptide beta-N-acetylglucosaminyltransferase [Treponema sp.]